MPTGENNEQVVIVVPKEVKEKLKEFGKNNRWSMSKAGAALLEEGLQRHGYLNSGLPAITEKKASKAGADLPSLNQQLINHLPQLIGQLTPERIGAIAKGEDLNPEEIDLLLRVIPKGKG